MVSLLGIKLANISPEKYLKNLFLSAVECSHPKKILKPALPIDRSLPVTVICAGKAAASMANQFEKIWDGPIKGLAVTPYGTFSKTKSIKVIQASHPTPDENSVLAAKEVLNLCSDLSSKDLVFVLLSGGGSSLLCLPEDNISLEDKQKANSLLLRCGASIDEINAVRKQISKIKGGKLLSHCNGAEIHTLAISDVFDDDPSIIASGPTFPDTSKNDEALEIMRKYKLDFPKSVNDKINQKTTAKDNLKININDHNKYSIIASPGLMLKNVEKQIFNDGYECINLGVLRGDSRTLGRKHAEMALTLNPLSPTVILSGGETTVKVIGNGKGGRNSEYLLSLAYELNDNKNIYALAADTDGIDGFTDAAGAYYHPKALQKLERPTAYYLDDNDSYTAFNEMNNLIKTGPTQTNVNDFRAILIMPND